MSQKTKEMAKYIVLGVNYYETGKEQRSFVENVLERYDVEKEKNREDTVVRRIEESEPPMEKEPSGDAFEQSEEEFGEER